MPKQKLRLRYLWLFRQIDDCDYISPIHITDRHCKGEKSRCKRRNCQLNSTIKSNKIHSSKGNKWYFYDNGIRNILINKIMPLNMRDDEGFLWENYLISEKNNYYHNFNNEYFFWRTYDRQEIDLIESRTEGSLNAFEFKRGKKILLFLPVLQNLIRMPPFK